MAEASEYASTARWGDLWVRLGAHGDSMSTFDSICAQYADSSRHYHNMEHIGNCLREFDSVHGLAHDPAALELAIWLHDVIYDSHAHDNEEQSAHYLLELASEAGIARVEAERGSDLILATKHQGQPEEFDAQLIVDIDLSILGQPWNTFEKYERQIRAEYAWVVQESFYEARKAILSVFLLRDSIFVTEEFRERYEDQARLNLKRSIDSITLNQGRSP